MIKGKYVGLVEVSFCVDENTPGLLPFEKLRRSVAEDFNGVIKKMIEEAVSGIATVEVDQQYADLYETRQ